MPGTEGTWRPVGVGPLHADDPDYPETYGTGFGQLAGRISDFAYDAAHDRLYAAVARAACGSRPTKGALWSSIGDALPTQTVGSIAYTPAGGGTLIAVTGDNAFGGDTFAGLGVYRSTDEGQTWQRSKRRPGSGIRASRPRSTRPIRTIVYAATGAGLFRSTDGGRRSST